MTTAQIQARAQAIAGAIWEDRDQDGTLPEQLRAVAEWTNRGTDGDLTEADRAALLKLAKEAARTA